MSEIRIIIAGSRDFANYQYLSDATTQIISTLNPDLQNTITIVSGTARGADRLGERFANENNYMIKRFPAAWDELGKRAGYVRNEQMAKYASENDNQGILVAFWDGESRGTKHMIDLANKYKLDVYVYGINEEKSYVMQKRSEQNDNIER